MGADDKQEIRTRAGIRSCGYPLTTGDKQRKPSTANRKDNSDTKSVGVVKNVGTKGEKNTAKGGKNTAKGGKNTAKGGKNTATDQKGPGIDKPIW